MDWLKVYSKQHTVDSILGGSKNTQQKVDGGINQFTVYSLPFTVYYLLHKRYVKL